MQSYQLLLHKPEEEQPADNLWQQVNLNLIVNKNFYKDINKTYTLSLFQNASVPCKLPHWLLNSSKNGCTSSLLISMMEVSKESLLALMFFCLMTVRYIWLKLL